MEKKGKGELVVVNSGFDYALLEAKVAERVRATAESIRQKVKRTLEGIIEVGSELLTVKEALPHGQFGAWLDAEFGWRERSARYFMAVAEQFGKTANFADLPIQPSAAYLLAAPSVPGAARQAAIERAEAGEQITNEVAKEIVAKAKKKGRRKSKPVPSEKLRERLVKVLERFKERWSPEELSALADQLRGYADELDKTQRSGKKAKKE